MTVTESVRTQIQLSLAPKLGFGVLLPGFGPTKEELAFDHAIGAPAFWKRRAAAERAAQDIGGRVVALELHPPALPGDLPTYVVIP